jgi:hypothetical protein
MCNVHADPFDCPDTLITYNDKFDEYGWQLKYRDNLLSLVWHEEVLEQLGFDDPAEQSIPEEFKTDKWYKNCK